MSAYMDPRVETAAGVPRSTDRAKRRGAALAIATGPPSERLFSQRPEEEVVVVLRVTGSQTCTSNRALP